MNRYFCSVGETVKAKIPQQPNFLITGKYDINFNNKTYHFAKITEEEPFSACNLMKISFGSGLDNISSFFIKVAIPILVRPLAYISTIHY